MNKQSERLRFGIGLLSALPATVLLALAFNEIVGLFILPLGAAIVLGSLPALLWLAVWALHHDPEGTR